MAKGSKRSSGRSSRGLGRGSRKGRTVRKPASRPKSSRVIQRRNQRNNQARRATSRATRPLPRSPRRSRSAPVVVPAPGVGRPSINEALVSRMNALQSNVVRIDREADLQDIYSQLGNIEEMFTSLPAKLDDLRVRGYVHSGNFEDQIEALDQEWDTTIRPSIERQLRQDVARLDRQMQAIERSVNGLSAPSERAVSQAESSLSTIESSISSARSNIQSLFQGVQSSLSDIQREVHDIEWMIEQIEQSPEINLLEAEGPLLAVEAEWEEDGADEGPDGILYLTDQRLLFEQKEEVVTKKFLFITTDSEVKQELLLDVPVREIEEIKHDEEKRGLLNLRKDDILELIFSARASVSRGRFHIRGEESSDWAAMIKRVQNGDIDRDRSEEFVEEMEEAAEVTASLPEQCPYCYAAVPPQPRGVTSYVCDFCDQTINARANGDR
ncbi:MAG: hypothetical protein QNJ45_19460 [Ardenticatenaceae bacterium]|nr:hypothetical protein [Ardenticatenaceae bacterium]